MRANQSALCSLVSRQVKSLSSINQKDFPLKEIKRLYRMRWSEETSFRELKYTIGLINWHSSKYDGILQEISARKILYNFCELVTAHAVVKTSKRINFATAVNICRAYLKHGGDETETMLLAVQSDSLSP